MDAENICNDGCSQRDSAEHKGYVRAHRSFNRIWKERDSAQPDLLEKILDIFMFLNYFPFAQNIYSFFYIKSINDVIFSQL